QRIEKKVEVEYVFQKMDTLVPADKIPADRVKPWGTTHALLCAKDVIKEGFAVINADDFYGRDAFMKAAEFIRNTDTSEKHYCMVGYMLGNTLTDNGSVARGVCHKDQNGMLDKIVERTKLFKEEGGAYFEEDGEKVHLTNDTVVSMNFWGFGSSVFADLEEDFNAFLNDPETNMLKGESLLPNSIGKMIKENKCDVKVLTTSAKWFGVTYADDKPDVIAKLSKLIEEGEYPDGLWK
ncbi:MAG: nucleotidyltransferase, partial [Eubacteriales bacterium]